MYEKILVINPFGIGDVLFTTPIIHTLKDSNPQGKIGYLCNRRSSPLLRDNPYIDYLFIYERDEFDKIKRRNYFAWIKENIKFLEQIKERHFDLAIDFSLNTQYGFFSWYAGIKTRIGYDFKGRGWLLTRKIKLPAGYNSKHIVEYYAALLGFIGLELKCRKLELFLENENVRHAEEMLERGGIGGSDLLVGIVPGAGRSWGGSAYLKHWPAENFARLADKIIENYPAKIIIIGDSSEKEICNKVISGMQHPAIDLSGRTTPGELAALLSKMKLVITNDGGPLHMAVALGIKTVSVFGPVNDVVYGPYPPGKGHIVVKSKVPCRPCYKNFRVSECANPQECLSGINPDEVFSAAKACLSADRESLQ